MAKRTYTGAVSPGAALIIESAIDLGLAAKDAELERLRERVRELERRENCGEV